MFVDTEKVNNLVIIMISSTLVPDRCTDDITALENFTRVFHARYASTGPILYIGSLEQAIQDSLHTSVHEVTLLMLICRREPRLPFPATTIGHLSASRSIGLRQCLLRSSLSQ